MPERTGFIGTGSVRIPGTERAVNDFIPGLDVQSAHKVDGRLPYVESAAFTSSPAEGETHRLGETIEVSLTFNKEVEVLGRPTIRLELGDSESRRDATYSSGEGSKTLVFAYTVLATDVDSDGVALTARESDGIDGPFRVYELDTENQVKATITGISSQSGHKVDGRPYITTTAITSTPANGDVYGAGETIEVSLTFDRAVDVEGTLAITLIVGSDEKDATYSRGSGTSTLKFCYSVQANDEDADGIAIGEDTLTLNGSTIEDSDDIATNLSHDSVTASGHLVDAVPPSLKAQRPPATAPVSPLLSLRT